MLEAVSKGNGMAMLFYQMRFPFALVPLIPMCFCRLKKSEGIVAGCGMSRSRFRLSPTHGTVCSR